MNGPIIRILNWEFECCGSASHEDVRVRVSHAYSTHDENLIRLGIDIFAEKRGEYQREFSHHELCEGILREREFCTWID